MTDPSPLFDLAQIIENWGATTGETYRIVLGIFVSEAEKLRAFMSAAGPADMMRLAHTLRGAAANVGAHRLASCAHTLEHADPESMAAALAALDAALADTLAAISAGGPGGDG